MVPTRIALKRSSNYHEAAFPKCRGVAEFHSIHELLCVALLEGDPKVVSIETQPEKIRGANGKAYIPDVRFQTVEKTTYLEVKSEGGWAREGKRIEPLLRAFATQRGADHGHCLHEQLDQQARRAFAFIRITRWILQYADTDLTSIRRDVLRALKQTSPMTIGDLVQLLGQHLEALVLASIATELHAGRIDFEGPEGFKSSTSVRLR